MAYTAPVPSPRTANCRKVLIYWDPWCRTTGLGGRPLVSRGRRRPAREITHRRGYLRIDAGSAATEKPPIVALTQGAGANLAVWQLPARAATVAVAVTFDAVTRGSVTVKRPPGSVLALATLFPASTLTVCPLTPFVPCVNLPVTRTPPFLTRRADAIVNSPGVASRP